MYLTEQSCNLGHLFDEILDLYYTYDFKVFLQRIRLEFDVNLDSLCDQNMTLAKFVVWE